MSRGLRVKVKHLLLAALILGVAGFGFVRASEGALFRNALAAFGSSEYDRALALFDRYLERCGDCPDAPEAWYRTASLLTLPPPQYVYAYMDGSRRWSGSSMELPADDVMSAEERYLHLIEAFPESGYARQAVERLSDIYMNEWRWDEAETLLNAALADERFRTHWASYALLRIQNADRRGDDARAIELAHDFLVEYPYFHPYPVYLLLGDIHLRLGDLDEAERWYDAAQAHDRSPRMDVVHSTDWSRGGTMPLHTGVLDMRRRMLEEARLLQQIDGGIVRGRIEGVDNLDGSVEVLIGRKELVTLPIPTSNQAFRVTMPDESGHFQFENLLPGEYILAIRFAPDAINLSQVRYDGPKPLVVEDSQVTSAGFLIGEVIRPAHPDGFVRVTPDTLLIEWSPVSGAEHYSLLLSARYSEGSVRTEQVREDVSVTTIAPPAWWELVSHSEETTFVADPSILRWTLPWDWEPHPEALPDEPIPSDYLLGMPHPGGEYTITIHAYDERGPIATTSSFPATGTSAPRTFQFGALEELSEAERLVKERKFVPAIELLEARLHEDPQDATAALILHRIYTLGTDAKRTHQNVERAREIAEHLLTLVLPEAIRDHIEKTLEPEAVGGRTD